jgi:hypothetical protein
LLSAGLIRSDGLSEAVPLPIISAWTRNGSGTSIILPRNLLDRRFSDVLGSTAAAMTHGATVGRLAAADVFAALPVALLEVA